MFSKAGVAIGSVLGFSFMTTGSGAMTSSSFRGSVYVGVSIIVAVSTFTGTVSGVCAITGLAAKASGRCIRP